MKWNSYKSKLIYGPPPEKNPYKIAKTTTPPTFVSPKIAKTSTPVPKVIKTRKLSTPKVSAKTLGTVLPTIDAPF